MWIRWCPAAQRPDGRSRRVPAASSQRTCPPVPYIRSYHMPEYAQPACTGAVACDQQFRSIGKKAPWVRGPPASPLANERGRGLRERGATVLPDRLKVRVERRGGRGLSPLRRARRDEAGVNPQGGEVLFQLARGSDLVDLTRHTLSPSH